MRTAVLSLLLLGCYDPGYGDSTHCSPSGECPTGRTCVSGFCLTSDGPPTSADGRPIDAPPTVADGRPIDAPPADARLDGGVTFEVVIAKTAGSTGVGTISGRTSGFLCEDDCESQALAIPLSQTVMLEAIPGPDSYFLGWSGDCIGIYRRCSLLVNQAKTVFARFATVNANLVFVTRDWVTADFGGLTAADEACRLAAQEVSLEGKFVALLAQGAVDLPQRLVRPGGGLPRGFIRLDGKPIADQVSDLVQSHNIWYPVLYDQEGHPAPDEVWTGSTIFGSTSTAQCGQWAVKSTGMLGAIGLSTGGPTLINSGAKPCSERAGFACVRVDLIAPLTAPSAAPTAQDRAIWVTGQLFSPSPAPLFTPDKLCEASRPGLGSARALITVDDEPASLRISPTARYVRPDGVVVGTGAQLLSHQLATGIWVQGNGDPSEAQKVWTGSTGISVTGPDDSCQGWTEEMFGTAIAGVPSVHVLNWWSSDPRVSCDTGSLPVYCVEE